MVGDVFRGILVVVVTIGGLWGALGVVVGLVERDMAILGVYIVWSLVFAILGVLVFWWIKVSRTPGRRGVNHAAGSAFSPGRPGGVVGTQPKGWSAPIASPPARGPVPGGPVRGAAPGGPSSTPARPTPYVAPPNPRPVDRGSATTRASAPARPSTPPVHSPSAQTQADGPARRPVTPRARPVAPSDPTLATTTPPVAPSDPTIRRPFPGEPPLDT
ncbi:hypothetical protein [Nocardia neocaledoniensis]|uniref:hypothetical protein n=1 Tax=Nocardia neocaledoniensis TaxID=236511 RepID=UPI0024553772|nr:hypothetical protein [Nocardia neocaledoniensis]